MFSKISTKWLTIIFAILLVLVVIVVVRNKSQSTASRNRTFKSELTDFDTAKVNSLVIYPKQKGDIIRLNRKDKGWNVEFEGSEYNADPSAIKGMLSSLVTLRATRIAANDKNKWKEFEVTDSAATIVQALEGKKIVADVYLGKFSYQQPKNANPYMQRQGSMTSYVRLAGDKEVYAVEGIIAMAFNRQPGDFRNRTIIRSSKENWNQLTIKGKTGSFSLTKNDGGWMIDGLKADSNSVAKYINSLAYLSNSNFIDESVLLSQTPAYTLTIEGENMAGPIKVDACPADTANMFAITSSLNNGTWFSGKESGLFEKIFKPKESFLPAEAKE
ncbi:MAG: DUF4340 domain-containing protein [Bacteroidales bacterium]|nr:DUF4340 domain-containing protein [Bacteroidales bacterium]